MGNNHRNDTKKRTGSVRRILRIAGITIVFCAAVGIAMYRDALLSQIGKTLAFAGSEETIPVLHLERGPIRIELQADGEIVGRDAVPVATPGNAAGALKLAWMISEGTVVMQGTPVIRFDSTDQLLNLESQNNTLDQNLLETEILNLDQHSGEKTDDLDRAEAVADYEYALGVLPEDPIIFSRWEILTAQQSADFAKLKIENLEAEAATRKQINRSQLQVLAIERNQIQTEVGIIQRVLAGLEVRAPANGMVVYRRDRRQDPKVGDSFQAGQVLIELVDLNALQARIYVLEREAGGLAVGKAAILKLDALPEKVFHGEVRSISPVAASLERDSSLKYFTCDIAILDAGSSLNLFRPGMTLQANVILEEYDSAYMVPASALNLKDGQAYVYVKRDEGFVQRQVQLGLGKHGQATILSGVSDGELMALQNPNEARQLTLPDFGKASAIDPQRGGGVFGGGRGK